jgi:hypothetical protein
MLTFRSLFQQVTVSADKERKPASMGRPPFPEGERRSERIVTFLTLEERSELARQAAAVSQSLSAYCHRLITDGLQNETYSNRETKP